MGNKRRSDKDTHVKPMAIREMADESSSVVVAGMETPATMTSYDNNLQMIG